MLHEVKLSKVIQRDLTEVALLQAFLICYAANATSTSFGKQDCANYLKNINRFKMSADDIANWLFTKKIEKELLSDILEKFARHQNNSVKQNWSNQVYNDIILLLKTPYQKASVNPLPLKFQWQQSGAKFLISFYKIMRSTTGLPPFFFSKKTSINFDGQLFLTQFIANNNGLFVCAACDEASFYSVISNSFRADIDHFLPKDLYPHLSCHPYNLVPICKLCNQSKSTKDPLKKSKRTRYSLQDICMPYRNHGIAKDTYMKEVIGASKYQLELLSRLPTGNINITDSINMILSIYEVPKRWAEKNEQIEEILFRRMRQIFRDGRGSSTADVEALIFNTLSQLLYYFHQEDTSKDPYTVPMTWKLVALMKEFNNNNGNLNPLLTKQALISEIADWLEQSISSEATKVTEELLSVFL